MSRSRSGGGASVTGGEPARLIAERARPRAQRLESVPQALGGGEVGGADRGDLRQTLEDLVGRLRLLRGGAVDGDRKSTRLNSSHGYISYAVFCLKKKKLARPCWLVSVTSSTP